MAEEADLSTAAGKAALTCPRCGAPLPLPGEDGFVTCDYCGVRTEVSSLVPLQREPPPPAEAVRRSEPPFPSSEDGFPRRNLLYIAGGVVAMVVVFVVIIAMVAPSQPFSNSAGSSVAHCSVTINASATSGPAPFSATFTAQVTAPPGVSTSEPMWQFGPFGPGLDLNSCVIG